MMAAVSIESCSSRSFGRDSSVGVSIRRKVASTNGEADTSSMSNHRRPASTSGPTCSLGVFDLSWRKPASGAKEAELRGAKTCGPASAPSCKRKSLADVEHSLCDVLLGTAADLLPDDQETKGDPFSDWSSEDDEEFALDPMMHGFASGEMTVVMLEEKRARDTRRKDLASQSNDDWSNDADATWREDPPCFSAAGACVDCGPATKPEAGAGRCCCGLVAEQRTLTAEKVVARQRLSGQQGDELSEGRIEPPGAEELQEVDMTPAPRVTRRWWRSMTTTVVPSTVQKAVEAPRSTSCPAPRRTQPSCSQLFGHCVGRLARAIRRRPGGKRQHQQQGASAMEADKFYDIRRVAWDEVIDTDEPSEDVSAVWAMRCPQQARLQERCSAEN